MQQHGSIFQKSPVSLQTVADTLQRKLPARFTPLCSMFVHLHQVQELVEKIEQLEEARGQLQRKISLQALPKPSAKPAAMAVTAASESNFRSSSMHKVWRNDLSDWLCVLCTQL